MWSVFENHHVIENGGNQVWTTDLVFYMGDLSTVDLKTDWRFQEVKGKRSELKFLGTCETEFPIKYPLYLNNGVVINKNDYS